MSGNNRNTGSHEPIDFVGLNQALLRQGEMLLAQWLPGGVERNGRYYVGDFDGGHGESANVNLTTGQWIDNADASDCGHDLISLYARVRGLNNGQAGRELMQQMGWSRPQQQHARAVAVPSAAPTTPALETDEPASAPAVPVARKGESKWKAIVPVPTHARAPSFKFGFKDKKSNEWVELDAVRTWRYEFDGVLYGYVARFERISSSGEIVKDTVPRTWCVDESDGAGTQRWHWKQWEAPRPLFVAAGYLGDAASKPVVLVEGEKCAEAGHALLGEKFDFVTWPGGCKTWSMAGWEWLRGRTVILWPDCDAQRERLSKAEREQGVDPASKPIKAEKEQPGMVAMVGVGTLLAADYGCTVRICKIPVPGAVSEGWDIADAIAQGWPAEQVEAFISGAGPFVPHNPQARAKIAADTLSSAGAGQEDPEARDAWRKLLQTTSNGNIRPARENVVLALDGMPDQGIFGIPEAWGVIAFNEFTNSVEKTRPTPWGTPAGPWDESDELELGNWLVLKHWLPPMSRQTLEEAVTMVARRHRYHPPRARFMALRGTWDGVRRLPSWLARVTRKAALDKDDPLRPYLARVGTWMMMAIVDRVLHPGCKFDYMPIFESKQQGWGKSTLARVLGGEHFADTGLVLGDKDTYQNLQGVLVYEWGELDSLTKSEITKVKQFISSQEDRFRASFDRRPKDYPRQVVFIGTTNESHYLTDTTGNRRFWPIKLDRPIDLDWVREHLDQLFAEALHYLDAGERYYPTVDEQRKLFDPQQGERTVESSIESAIRIFLYDENQRPAITGINGSLLQQVSLTDLLKHLGLPLDKQTPAASKQASAALGRLGWERTRTTGAGGGARPYVYTRPAEEPAEKVVTAGNSGSGCDEAALAQGSDEGGHDDCPF